MAFTVAIVGRPNVGKSTLFNRLVGRRAALVDDTPGLTRDRREGAARLGPLRFRVIDTAGLEEAAEDTLESAMRRQTERALAESDLVLMLVDARAGVTPLDAHFAAWLRRTAPKVLLVVNKSEGRAAGAGILEAYELGLGEPVAISAAHGIGLADLAEALLPYLGDDGDEAVADAPQAGEGGPGEAEDDRPIRLAIAGRPNVGKSTLVNALLGEERMLTGPEPGVTRDAIEVEWRWRGRAVRLVDTAGLRRRARIEEPLEKLSAGDSIAAIGLSDVVVLVLDARQMLERQDLAIARHVAEEGRALVIAVNKWDLVEDARAAQKRLGDRLETSLPQLRGVRIATVSALKGHGLDRLMDEVLAAHGVWTTRLATGPLNRWLEAMLEAHPPPLVAGRRLKLRYVTQVKARPPTFALWTSHPEALPEAYERYLINGLRERFGLAGVPVRILLRKGRNPYAGKAD
jgi:GTP-binding protein